MSKTERDPFKEIFPEKEKATRDDLEKGNLRPLQPKKKIHFESNNQNSLAIDLFNSITDQPPSTPEGPKLQIVTPLEPVEPIKPSRATRKPNLKRKGQAESSRSKSQPGPKLEIDLKSVGLRILELLKAQWSDWRKKRTSAPVQKNRRFLQVLLILTIAAYLSTLPEEKSRTIWYKKAVHHVRLNLRSTLITLSDKIPILSILISTVPTLEDVNPIDFSALKHAATAEIKKVGPQLAIALSEFDSDQPRFYIGSNFPIGTKLYLEIQSLPHTLVEQLNITRNTDLRVFNRITITPKVLLETGQSLPRGEYEVSVYIDESEFARADQWRTGKLDLDAEASNQTVVQLRLLTSKTFFLGGSPTPEYKRLLEKKSPIVARDRRLKLDTLKEIQKRSRAQLTESIDVFYEIYNSTNSNDKKLKRWKEFREKWLAKNEDLAQLVKSSYEKENTFHRLYPVFIAAKYAGQAIYRVHDRHHLVLTELNQSESTIELLEPVESKAREVLGDFEKQLAKAELNRPLSPGPWSY